jgi:hypothetical protein
VKEMNREVLYIRRGDERESGVIIIAEFPRSLWSGGKMAMHDKEDLNKL